MPIIPLSDVFDWVMNGWLPLRTVCLEWSQQLASVVVTALWQGSLVAFGLAVCLRFARSITAANRFLLWSAGFTALVVLSASSLLPFRMGGAAPAMAAPHLADSGPLLQLDLRWSLLIAVFWLLLTSWRAFDLLLHIFQLRKLYKSASPIAWTDLPLDSFGIPGSLVRQGVEFCATASLQRPCFIGFLAPRILIPDWLYPQLTPAELDQILRHELEHLRRRDDWTNLFQKLCLLLFPLNPALLWIERRLCQEREMACDDAVIGATHAPRAYAECLARLSEYALRYRGESLSLGVWQRRPELVRRVHSVLLRTRPAGPLATFTTLAVLACGLLCATVELARCPQLIAFVPSDHSALKAIQHSRPARLEPATLALASHAAQLKAAGVRPAHPVNRQASGVEVSSNLRSQRLSSSTDSTEPQFADVIVPELPEQPLLVLSAINRLQLAASDFQIVSDFEMAPDSAPDWAARPSPPAPGQVTITRLIVRILPSAYDPGHPAVAPNRGSWLVIQL
jgi:hypothetical protein